jgi:trehalose 6-phosphate synthase
VTAPRAGPSLGPSDVGPAYREAFPDHRIIVVSNREPYEHSIDEATGEIVVRRPAGGLISALDPLLQAVGGTWIAWGSGEADAQVTDERDRVRVPPETESYTLRRLWLGEQDINHYYFGYSNQFLWPLCHLRPALTRTRMRYWVRYHAVNERFAQAALDEASAGAAAIWFQDYHLAVAPAVVRRRNPDLPLAHFWHIPFPPLEIFRIASNGRELLAGMLANDIMGFHLPLFGDNFLRSAESVLGADVDWARRCATYEGHTCFVRAFPISIDIGAFERAAHAEGSDRRIARLRERFAPAGQLGFGVDRIDYSKGLEEKFTALDHLWHRYPDLRGTFSYVQVAVASRSGIEAYDWLNERLGRLVLAINERHGTNEWRPIHFLNEAVSAERLAVFYRAADVCIVSSLQDGMNLVAKEFIASQDDARPGVLVLSKFAGAAAEMEGHVQVNPFDTEDFAEQIHDALVMPLEERRERLLRLKGSLRSVYDWMAETFTVWGPVVRGEDPPLSAADRWRRVR